MDLHSLFIDSDEGGRSLDPASGVEVLDPVFRPPHRQVGVAAENPLRMVRPSVGERAGGYFGGVPPPASVETIDQLRQAPLT
jgi:hypothetical protein